MSQKDFFDILCFGDSLTAGSPGYDPAFGGNRHFQYGHWMLERAHAQGWKNLRFQNHGMPGDLASLMARRLERVLNLYRFDASVILAGTNDLGMGSSVLFVFESLQELWNLCISRDLPVVSCTIPPIGSVYPPLQRAQEQLNTLVRDYCKEHNRMICVDLFAELATPDGLLYTSYDSGDGLHLSMDGYRKIGEAVWEKGIRVILSEGR